MSLLAEGLLAMRGCWRFIRRDPEAFEDFNLTIAGFWRSFAMVLPVAVLAYPLFMSGHQFDAALAAQQGQSPPVLQLGRDYVYLLAGIAIWPVAAALLARLFGVAQNYVRYVIIYNWMAVPIFALTAIPHLMHLATGAALLPTILAQAILFLALYVNWRVARAGLEATAPVASAFLLADLALSFGLYALMR